VSNIGGLLLLNCIRFGTVDDEDVVCDDDEFVFDVDELAVFGFELGVFMFGNIGQFVLFVSFSSFHFF
jgi:hypothetical protein